jgi:O-antigen biosynthesis protein
VFQRLPMDTEVGNFLSLARERMAALVFDIDDYIFDIAVYQSHDVFNQVTPEHKAILTIYSAQLRETLLACDYFIGTTFTLAQAASNLGCLSFVIRNGLSDYQVALAEKVIKRSRHPQKADGIIRIGYQPGSRTHQKDFLEVLAALIRILETFPHVRLVIQGFLEIPKVLQPFQDRIEHRPYVSWKKLLEKTAQLDLAIVPLEPHSINEAKSALKYFESGLVEVPVVASPTEDFRKAICHRTNGLLAVTEDEWFEALRLLISDGSLRRRMGKAARQDALTYYTSAAQSENTRRVFEAIVREQTRRKVKRLA